jgi:hypothetical protein
MAWASFRPQRSNEGKHGDWHEEPVPTEEGLSPEPIVDINGGSL